VPPPPDNGGRPTPRPDADLVQALLARVEEIDERLRTIPVASDEKALKELRRTVEALAKRDPKFEERVTNRIDVIADRMETFAKTVSTTSAALAAKDGEIAQLRRDLQAAAARVDAAVQELARAHDPGALAELRRTVAELSTQKLPRGIENRIEDLAAKLSLLAERVDTVSSTASMAAARLGGRDGELVALREAVEEESARTRRELEALRLLVDPAALEQLREALSGLSGHLTALQRASQQSQLELRGTDESLAGRLDAVETSLQAALGKLTTADEQLAGLRARLEGEAARQASALDGVEQSLRALASRIAAQEDLSSLGAERVDREVASMGSRVEALASQVEALAAALGESERRLEEREDGLEELRRDLRERTARVDALVGDLMRALAGFPGDAVPLLEARLGEVTERMGALASRLDDTEERERTLGEEVARATVAWEHGRAGSEELAGRVDSLASALDAIGRTLAERDEGLDELRRELSDSRSGVDALADLAARLERAVLEEDLEQLRTDLERRAAEAARQAAADAARGLPAAVDELGERVERLAARLSGTDDERDRLTAEVARLSALVDVERAATRGRLEALASTLDDSSAVHDLEQHVAALAARLDADRAAVQAQVDAVANALAAPLVADVGRGTALGARLDELARRLDDLERKGALWPAALRSLEARLDSLAPRAPRLSGPADDGDDEEEPPPPAAAAAPAGEDEHGDAVERFSVEPAAASAGRWPSLSPGEP